MSVKRIETPYAPNELARDLNDNFAQIEAGKANVSDLAGYIPGSQKGAASGVATLDSNSKVEQTAKKADEATNYDADSGTIKTKFDAVDGDITNIKNGTTPAGKARELAPSPVPAPSKYLGTDPAGNFGYFDLPEPDQPPQPLSSIPFTSGDARWGVLLGDVYALTVPHSGRYASSVLKQDGTLYTEVSVDISRDNTNILVKSMGKFDGVIIVG